MEGLFSASSYGVMGQTMWEQVKAPLIVPFMNIMVTLCLVMSIMLFVERVYMGLVIVVVKLMKYKLDKRYKWEAIKEDLETGNSVFPMVLVQIPMYNEKEVCIMCHINKREIFQLYKLYFLFVCMYRSINFQLVPHAGSHGHRIGS